MDSGVVNFVSLAYLIEIAFVINLAYRELRFFELDTKLKKTIYKKITQYSRYDTEKFREDFLELKSLIDDSVDKNFNGDKSISDPWEGLPLSGFFYRNFIRRRLALTITNYSLGFCVLAIIFVTSFHIPYNWFFFLDEEEKKLIWMVLFVFLIFLCVFSLVSMILTARCKIHLFGSRSKHKIGVVMKVCHRIDLIIAIMDSRLVESNNKIKKFSVERTNENGGN